MQTAPKIVHSDNTVCNSAFISEIILYSICIARDKIYSSDFRLLQRFNQNFTTRFMLTFYRLLSYAEICSPIYNPLRKCPGILTRGHNLLVYNRIGDDFLGILVEFYMKRISQFLR